MRRILAPVILGIVASLSLTACGGGDGKDPVTVGAATDSCPDGVAAVTVSWFPLAYTAYAQAAIDENIFAAHCLNVTKAETSTNSAIAAQLQSGGLTFAIYNIGSAVAAVSQGLDLRAVAPGFFSGPDNGVYATKASGITSLADLAGKKVALGSTESNTHAGFVKQLEEAGVDPASVEVVLVPVPQLLASLTSGQYDAAQIMEPWIALGGEDIVPLTDDIAAPFGEHAPLTVWTSTSTFAHAHPEIVENFQAALAEGVELVNSDPDVLRNGIINGSEIPPQAVNAIRKPYFSSDMNQESMLRQIEVMNQLGFFTSEPNAAALFGH